jgi:hypothetical protein
MEKQDENLRDRLLARLPQPENLAAYREEVTVALAKHEKALFWEKMPSTVCYVSTFAIVMADNLWGQKLAAATTHFIWLWAGLLFFVGAINDLRYHINRSKVDMLKEVKQVQLQVLALQASLQDTNGK